MYLIYIMCCLSKVFFLFRCRRRHIVLQKKTTLTAHARGWSSTFKSKQNEEKKLYYILLDIYCNKYLFQPKHKRFRLIPHRNRRTCDMATSRPSDPILLYLLYKAIFRMCYMRIVCYFFTFIYII